MRKEASVAGYYTQEAEKADLCELLRGDLSQKQKMSQKSSHNNFMSRICAI